MNSNGNPFINVNCSFKKNKINFDRSILKCALNDIVFGHKGVHGKMKSNCISRISVIAAGLMKGAKSRSL